MLAHRTLLAGLFFAASGGAASFALDRVPWRELEFHGSKFGISLHAELALEAISSAQARGELLPSVRGPGIVPSGNDVLVVSLGSEVLGRRSDIRLLIDPHDGAALQRIQTDSGKKHRIKSIRYGERGLSGVRLRPAEGERELPPERWTDERRDTDEYPVDAPPDLRVSDPTALFFLIAASEIETAGDSVEIPLFSDDRLILVEAKALDLRRVDVDYERVDGSGTRRVRGPTTVLRLALEARALGAGDEDASFELAGMRGDVEMLLDRTTRAPLELSGRVPYVGRVAIRLRRVVERSEPAAPRSQPSSGRERR
jgi:hypothetical protein